MNAPFIFMPCAVCHADFARRGTLAELLSGRAWRKVERSPSLGHPPDTMCLECIFNTLADEWSRAHGRTRHPTTRWIGEDGPH